MMFRQGLKSKILFLTIGLALIGFGVLIFLIVKEEEKGLLRERRNASELMAQPILHTIYKDMLDERADMPRFLIEGLKTIKGVERVQIIRANGVEEAFQDYKTLKAVKAEFGEIKPEWLEDHHNRPANMAVGVRNQAFKAALQSFNSGVREPVYYIESAGGKSLFTYLVPIAARPKCSACHANNEAARGVLMISTSLDGMYGELRATRNRWIIYGAAAIASMTALMGLLVSVVITRPIDRTVALLRAIAEGKGAGGRLEAASGDEVGELGRAFNRFADRMGGVSGEILGISVEAGRASKEVEAASRELVETAGKQIGAASETSASINEMDVSIKTVAQEASALAGSAVHVQSSIETVAGAADEVRANVERLLLSASSTASSINQIDVSISQVAAHVDALFAKTEEEVVGSIIEVSAKAMDVEGYARRQAEAAERVRADAEDPGLSSVIKTREGIERVNQEVAAAAFVIHRLGERSREITKALAVIRGIAGTAQVLALNAAMLAQQSDDHGKGFAVVARQMKDLASRAAASTEEIAGLINLVQHEAGAAVESMQRSALKAEDGLALSRGAEDALMKILESARGSFELAKLIEKAAIEQTRGAGRISNAAHTISRMTADIKKAAGEQTGAASFIQKDTVRMKEFMEKVNRSALEQSRESAQAGAEIADVVEKIKRVAAATRDQGSLSMRIVAAAETVRDAAEDNARNAARLEATVDEMNRLAGRLKDAVGGFKA
ncbi:MAG: HAMP domain-containing protein [Deltaproteobacteria bacterium]|nr:HAMP domain-containing protein [Deltaproteobacteria bacterium]